MQRIGNRKNPNWEWGEESKRRRWNFFEYLDQLPNLKNIEEAKKRKKEIIILLLLWGLFSIINFVINSSESISSLGASGGVGYLFLFLAFLSTFTFLVFAHSFCYRFSLSWGFLKIRLTKQLLIISIIAICLASCLMVDTYLDFYNIKLIDLLPPYNKQ